MHSRRAANLAAPTRETRQTPCSDRRGKWLPRNGAAVAFVVVVGGLVSAASAVRADEAMVHYNLGLQLKRDGRVADAIGEVEQAIKARPTFAAAHFTLGN